MKEPEILKNYKKFKKQIGSDPQRKEIVKKQNKTKQYNPRSHEGEYH